MLNLRKHPGKKFISKKINFNQIYWCNCYIYINNIYKTCIVFWIYFYISSYLDFKPVKTYMSKYYEREEFGESDVEDIHIFL